MPTPETTYPSGPIPANVDALAFRRAFLDAYQSDDGLELDDLMHDYRDGGPHFRAGVSATLIAICGWGMPALVEQSEREA